MDKPRNIDSVPKLLKYRSRSLNEPSQSPVKYRTLSLDEYSQYPDIVVKDPECEDLPQAGVTKVKDAVKKLKDIGAKFNEKSCRYDELSDKCFNYELELTAIEEAIAAQQELINLVEEQKTIFVNFRIEAPSSERESLDLNYSLVESRCAEQKSELESLEQKYSNLSEKRRTCEAEMNMLKPDLWKLELKREKYMLFLEERNMKPEEVEILARITDFALYELPLTDEEESVDLSPEYWLFGELDRETIKKYLENTPDGTFLVRESTRNRGMKAVSIMFDRQIKHFCIEEGPEGFGFAEGFKNHPTLQSLVEYYHRVLLQMHNSSVATTLRMPVRLVKLDLLPWIGSTP